MEQFLARHALDNSFLQYAAKWFDPLAEDIARSTKLDSCVFLGISGSQGSGKSTLADYLATVLCEKHKLRCAQLSIDDYYLSRFDRERLAKEAHPLFAQRGVPGTHNIKRLLADVALLLGKQRTTISTPLFSKQNDEPLPESEWQDISTPLDVLILEGWCVGVSAQSPIDLEAAVNSLEQDEDSDGIWRTAVNQILAAEYQTLFQQFDSLVYLKAPSFGCVFDWRWEQERKLLERMGSGGAGQMSPDQLHRFLQYYQRLTEHAIQSLPPSADATFTLDSFRKITSYSRQV